jgi:membrane protease YdiL (CAAX protease family)
LNLAVASLLLGAAPFQALAAQWPSIFTSYLPLLLVMILFPALIEEPGWRGFALPRLQARYGPLAGTLILGFLHGIWHLPVYALVSGPAAMGPFDITVVITNTISMITLTIFWTWVFNHADGSILIAVLLHAANNAAGNFFPTVVPDLPASFSTTLFAVQIASAAILVVATRGRLGYSQEQKR